LFFCTAMQISWCSFGTSVVSMKRNEKTTSNTLYRIRKEMVAYGNGFYLAMVDVNERVSGNWSRSKVLLHLICYKVWSSVGVEPSLFFDNIVTSMFE